MTDPLVVDNLWKTYRTKQGPIHALRGVSFTVRKGEIFGLLGPNGAGKSTTINILTGLLSQDKGTVTYFGEPFSESVAERINASTVYRVINNDMTVEENLLVYAYMYNVRQPKERITELLRLFHSTDLRYRRMKDLSAGQRTRISLCKSLINSPQLLFLDEATAGLDPDIAAEVRQAIKQLDTTIIFTSHQMHEVEELCDRIAFINHGRVVTIGTADELKKSIRNNRLVVSFSKQPRNAGSVLRKLRAQRVSVDTASFELKDAEVIDGIIHSLVRAKFTIRELHIERPTLEEVFITLAKKQ